MVNKLPIIEQDFITSSNKKIEGKVEKVVDCALWLCKVNVRKNCGKCLSKERISYKDGYVLCNYKK